MPCTSRPRHTGALRSTPTRRPSSIPRGVLPPAAASEATPGRSEGAPRSPGHLQAAPAPRARRATSRSRTTSTTRPRGRGLGRRTRRDAAAASTPDSTSRPTTASSSPERSPATAGGTGTDVRGDRLGRSPQVALERHHAAPSCGRGRAAEPSRRCWPAWPSRPSSHRAGTDSPRSSGPVAPASSRPSIRRARHPWGIQPGRRRGSHPRERPAPRRRLRSTRKGLPGRAEPRRRRHAPAKPWSGPRPPNSLPPRRGGRTSTRSPRPGRRRGLRPSPPHKARGRSVTQPRRA